MILGAEPLPRWEVRLIAGIRLLRPSSRRRAAPGVGVPGSPHPGERIGGCVGPPRRRRRGSNGTDPGYYHRHGLGSARVGRRRGGSLRACARVSCVETPGESLEATVASTLGGSRGDVFTAEAAEGAEMKGSDSRRACGASTMSYRNNLCVLWLALDCRIVNRTPPGLLQRFRNRSKFRR